MVKSKSSCLGKLPKEQICQFLIGPISSWFMPSATDIWTHPKGLKKEESMLKVSQDELMDYQSLSEENASSSYFIYGSIGCFCYGKINHHQQQSHADQSRGSCYMENKAEVSAYVDHLIDVKEDNSRVSCVRFLKKAHFPLAMILTESGSLIIHDCKLSENLIHFKKSELISRLIEPSLIKQDESNGEHCSKRTKFNITQQINSCVWPDSRNAFLGISLLKEKTNLVYWLKLKDLVNKGSQVITKADIVESFEKLELELPQYSSPICCMESAMLDQETCLLAIAMDDGLITVVTVSFKEGQKRRIIKLVRHNDQICSMSLCVDNQKKFARGLLASVSRNGLVLIWDIENEFYFADYIAIAEGARNNSKINWFALSLISSSKTNQINLILGNADSGLSVLGIPENARSKIRLKDVKEKQQQKRQGGGEPTIRHHSLVFNIAHDPITNTLITSSLDGNHILWKYHSNQEVSNKNGKKDIEVLEVNPQYLYPSMSNNSRTHMLRHNPIREDLLGIALGKAGIKFFKVSENHQDNRFDMNPSCSLIARKITKANLSPTSLAWHPNHEYRVAIGTLEGKVLRADLTPRRATLNESEPSQRLIKFNFTQNYCNESAGGDDLFGVEYKPLERESEEQASTNEGEDGQRQSVGGQLKTDGVYSLCWGPNPCCPHDMSRSAIYAIGSISHRLFIYHNKKESSEKLTNYLDEFADQSLPEAIGEASEVGWKSSMDLMALGTTTGKIVISKYLDESHEDRSRNQLFVKLVVIQGPLGHTYIQCLAWHPTTDREDTHYYFIAASANESPAYVFNIKETMLVADVKSKLKIGEGALSAQQYEAIMSNKATNVLSNYVCKMDCHKKAISDIAWNPHDPTVLATSSFDRFCYIWSLEESDSVSIEGGSVQYVSKFSARDRLFTLEWSLVDPDLVFTSGHDSTIWAWRPSENRISKNEQVF